MKKSSIKIWAVIVWLAVWQIASMVVGREIFFPAPSSVVKSFFTLCLEAEFWRSAFHSLLRIMAGCLLGTVLGVALAHIASRRKAIEDLLAPLMLVMKTIPVASFVILALILFSSKNLSILISFLLVLPLMYTNTLVGIGNIGAELQEMSRVFGLPRGRHLRYISFPKVYPFFYAAMKTAVGMAWKAGIAAEVIGVPTHSIGEKLYRAKVYLETPELFAWTILVILLSFATEKIIVLALGKLAARLKQVPEGAPMAIRTSETAERGCAIRVAGLAKSFGDQKVIENLHLSAPRGRTSCIMGMSGAGKTTLLRLIAGLETPDSGEIIFVPEEAAEDIAMVFQEDRLIEDLGAIENVRVINPAVTSAEVAELLGSLELKDEELGKPIGEFSGGMKRRVALARALMAGKSVLLMDEPFKGLDEKTKRSVMKRTREYINEKLLTVLLVTHDAEEADAMQADAVLEM